MKKYHFCFWAVGVAWLIYLLLPGQLKAQEEPAEAEKVEEPEPDKKVEEPESVEKDKQGKKVKKNVMFHLDPLIVNLARSQGSRFLKIAISLEMSSPEVRDDLDKNIRKLTDSILLLLSTKSFEDVYSVQGKCTLKGEITTRVNQFLTVGQVKGTYFTEFLIQ